MLDNILSDALSKKNKETTVSTNNLGKIGAWPKWVRLPETKVPLPLIKLLKNGLKPTKTVSWEEKQYLNLTKIILEKKIPPSYTHHLELMKVLLLIEQYYIEKDIESYNMKNQKPIIDLDNNSRTLQIVVPDLNEDDPFISIGDFVCVDRHRLKIFEIKNGWLKAEADKPLYWFQVGRTYDIKFKLNDYSQRCHIFAINHMMKCNKKNIILHPKLKPYKLEEELSLLEVTCNTIWFNRSISTNDEQKQAIKHIINKTAKPAPYILFGPPGTGKTATIVEAILQIHSNPESNKVLVCTSSNAASDEITRRLLGKVSTKDILRFYSPSRELDLVDVKIIPCSNIKGEIDVSQLQEKKIIISTLNTCVRLLGYYLNKNYFSYVFIDEAAQASEPETLVPFTLLGTDLSSMQTQFVFSGDPKQLGPVVKNKLISPLLGISMMERLMTLEPYQKNQNNGYNPKYLTKLVKNFRSHEAILKVPNELFYDNKLVACGGPGINRGLGWKHLPNKKFPVIFHGVAGSEAKEKNRLSVFNKEEIEVILQYLKKLKKGFSCRNIGVVTPFKLQQKLIKGSLRKNNMSQVMVGTAQTFQGQEKDVIIVSTVRSKMFQHKDISHLGFLSCTRRFVVSVSRAKCLLIVVGNPHVLKYDETWNQFLSYCLQNKACLGETFSLQLSEEERRNLIKSTVEYVVKEEEIKSNDKPIVQKIDLCEFDDDLPLIVPRRILHLLDKSSKRGKSK